MARGARTTSIEGEVRRTSPDAVLVREKGGREYWVPRSVIIDGATLEKGDTDIEIQNWWIDKS